MIRMSLYIHSKVRIIAQLVQEVENQRERATRLSGERTEVKGVWRQEAHISSYLFFINSPSQVSTYVIMCGSKFRPRNEDIVHV